MRKPRRHLRLVLPSSSVSGYAAGPTHAIAPRSMAWLTPSALLRLQCGWNIAEVEDTRKWSSRAHRRRTPPPQTPDKLNAGTLVCPFSPHLARFPIPQRPQCIGLNSFSYRARPWRRRLSLSRLAACSACQSNTHVAAPPLFSLPSAPFPSSILIPVIPTREEIEKPGPRPEAQAMRNSIIRRQQCALGFRPRYRCSPAIIIHLILAAEMPRTARLPMAPVIIIPEASFSTSL